MMKKNILHWYSEELEKTTLNWALATMVWRWWQRQSPLSWLNWICWKNMNVSIINYIMDLFFECSCSQTPSTIYDTHFYITWHKKMKLTADWSRKNTAGWIFRVFVKNSFSIGKGWGDSVQLHWLWPFVSHKNKHTWLSEFCWKLKLKVLKV